MNPTVTTPVQETRDPNDLSAKLNAGGVTANYLAHFDAGQLQRIDEQREPQGAAATTGALSGEYTYQGARLVRYRGAKITQQATLDLKFDPREVVISGRGPDVTDEELSAIRNRAQLLRSHALAQRESRGHADH